jgi:glycosyltransferase involved in cell wall biosynthesis
VHKVKKVEGKLVKNCDLIFVCSDEDAQGFSDLYGVDKKKILIIPNGASIRDIPFPNTEEKESTRNHFGLEKGPTAIFLASGGYEPNDNAAEYICLKLAPLLNDITFILVGSACDIILNKHSNQLTENIKLMGVVSQEDKKNLLYSSDLALNPVTKGSGTNIKVFDYLAAGLPLVTTPVGARGIDFTNNEDVVIAEIDDFPEVIKMLINDDALRSSISKKGRELAEKYDWGAIAKIAEKKYAFQAVNKLRESGNVVNVVSPEDGDGDFTTNLRGWCNILKIFKYALFYDQIILQYHESFFYDDKQEKKFMSILATHLSFYFLFIFLKKKIEVIIHEIPSLFSSN